MSTVDKIEKLAALKQSGAITEEEFQAQKQTLLSLNNTPTGESKDQMVYVLLAFFLGGFGVHNFYAGYTKKGIVQLLMTLLSPLTGGLLLIGVGIWVIVNIFAVNRDARGIPFKPAKTLKIVLGIIMSILMFFATLMILLMLAVFSIGVHNGYTTATKRYNANTVLEQAALLSIQAQITQENQEIPFKDQEQGGVDKMAAFPDGIVQMQITDAALATQVRKIAGDKVVSGCRGTGSCIIRFGE